MHTTLSHIAQINTYNNNSN